MINIVYKELLNLLKNYVGKLVLNFIKEGWDGLYGYEIWWKVVWEIFI